MLTATIPLSLLRRAACLSAAILAAACVMPIGGKAAAQNPATPDTTLRDHLPGDGRDDEHSVGDPYFPRLGHDGIDVLHYDLNLTYRPPPARPGSRPTPTGPPSTEAPPTAAPPSRRDTPRPQAALPGALRPDALPRNSPDVLPGAHGGRLSGVATLTLRARTALPSFALDLHHSLKVSSVLVNGSAAVFRSEARKLFIAPATPLDATATALVIVQYAAVTGVPHDTAGVPYGWVTLPGGAVAANAPDGASTWFPANDHPSDPATYRLRITVPEGLTAVASGLPTTVVPQTRAGMSRWEWNVTEPTPPHLLGLAVGSYTLTEERLRNGTTVVNAFDTALQPTELDRARTVLARLPALMDVYERAYGRYPHRSFGAVVDRRWDGYVVPSHTRTTVSASLTESELAKSLASQWFGDAIPTSTWRDVWLTEAMSTYAVWQWLAAPEHGARVPLQSSVDAVLAIDPNAPFWDVVVADPGPRHLFAAAVQLRGATALHAVAQRCGEPDASRLLRRWVATHTGGPASTEEFTRFVTAELQCDAGAALEPWIYSDVRPSRVRTGVG